MKLLSNYIWLLLLITALLFMSGCNNGGHSNKKSETSDSKWDQMVWDKDNWE